MTDTVKNVRRWAATKWETLIDVNVDSNEDIRLGRLFNTLMVISTAIVILLVIVFLMMIPLGLSSLTTTITAAIFPFVFIPLSIYCIWLAKGGHIKTGISIYVWINFIGISVAAWFFDGVDSPAWLLYIWAITIAGTLLRPVYSLWMTSGVVVYYALMFLCYRLNLYFPLLTFGVEGKEYVSMACLLIMFISTVGLLTYLNMKSLQTALSNLHYEIAERKQTEIKLNESYEKYRTVADFTYDWEYWLGPDGNYFYISPSCERITGYGPHRFFTQPDLLTSIIHPDDRYLYVDHLKEVMNVRCDVKKLDFRINTLSGKERWISHTCQSVYGLNGKWLGRRGTNRDVTERKIAEAEIRKINEELQELNANKDKFFSIISHDLRSPFNGLINASEILMDNFDSFSTDEKKDFIRKMNASVKNVYKLLENILQWSIAQRGKMEYLPQKIALSNFVQSIIESIHEESQNKKICIEIFVGKDAFVLADLNMLNVVLRNLITNSIKFTTSGGKINISSDVLEQFVRISIRDNGIGIKAEDIKNVFYVGKFRSTNGTEGEKGTGLGLPLCKDFVEKHGGTISIESEPGKGTSISFTLPKA